MDDKTFVTHQPIPKLINSNRPLIAPIYQSVKFTTDTMADLSEVYNENRGRYVYSRVSNPTVRQLEETLAHLQGCEDAICTGSGVSSISTVMLALLAQNDHVVMFYESYKPSRTLLKSLLHKFGVTHTFVSITDYDAFEAEVSNPKTKMVLFESPTNPITRVPDIEKIVNLCKKHHVYTVLDNTFAGFHNHHQFEVDLYIHSLTKFANGHGDALGGAILGNKEMINTVLGPFIELGPCMDPNTAFLILRGIKTYFLRYEKQCANAQIVAEWLESQPQIKNIYFPGLKSHPDHEIAKKQLKDFGSVIAIDLKCHQTKYANFIEALKLIKLSGSLGSTESLLAPTELFYGLDLTEDEKQKALITATGIRLSIGIENPQDLIEDLKLALAVIA